MARQATGRNQRAWLEAASLTLVGAADLGGDGLAAADVQELDRGSVW